MGEKQSPLWTARELKKATKGKWMGDTPPDSWDQLRVSYDIRGLKPGNLVVCMAPSTWGGHVKDTSVHLAKIAAEGAAGAIIQRDQLMALPKLPRSFPLLLVKDTFKALVDMAEASRARFKGKVVAITGTVGKTTSREMLLHVGSRQGGATATRANNNNIAGVARTMAYTPREHGWAAIEMGFGIPKEGISKSSKIVSPHVSLITSVSNAHLDMFTAQELAEHPGDRLVLSWKSKIVDGLARKGTAVFCRDTPHFDLAQQYTEKHKARLLSFGEHPEANCRLVDVQLAPKGSKIRADFDGREIEYGLQVPGKHMAVNSIGVLACILAGGGDLEQAARDIGDFEPVAGRSRVIDAPLRDGQIQLIDDSFNATPSSVESTLALLKLADLGEGGRRVAALGEIGHLGPNEAKIHADLAELIERYEVDKLFTWGPLMKHLYMAVPADKRGQHCETVPELYAAVRAFLQPGDALTVKSGRGQGGLGDVRFRKFIHALKENAEVMPS